MALGTCAPFSGCSPHVWWGAGSLFSSRRAAPPPYVRLVISPVLTLLVWALESRLPSPSPTPLIPPSAFLDLPPYLPLPFGMCFIPPYVFSPSLILISPSNCDLLSFGLIPLFFLQLFLFFFRTDLLLRSVYALPAFVFLLRFFHQVHSNNTMKHNRGVFRRLTFLFCPCRLCLRCGLTFIRAR